VERHGVGHAALPWERHVCVHVALFLQCDGARVPRGTSSVLDGRWQLHVLDSRVQTVSARERSGSAMMMMMMRVDDGGGGDDDDAGR
jgi:hypothetical protein